MKPTPNRMAGFRARLHDATDERYARPAASFWRPDLGAKLFVIETIHLKLIHVERSGS